ncbi:MAG: ArdC-like ssDNA-binding domain-containing protein [Eshraghiella crossota]|uniref:ArdC-like ssDNA-binding domain-containing protein n=1 Tax=Eshraghiella crossota TaxID=45851 RepID=UPI003999956D
MGQIPDSIQKKIDWLESRDKRTDELQQITDKLEKGVVEVFQSDRYKQFLDTMAKFPRYSVNNSLLIMMQKPDAQLCQSFTGWKQMGRYVKKGEKGRPVFDADGEPVKEKVEVTIRAFKVVKTFDLSQTDGKELPTIGPSELVGNIEGYPKLLQALQEISPVPVSFELIDGDAKGFYHLEDKKIVVQDGMSEVQTIKTLLHEMAHQKLHDKDNVPEAKDISRNGKEVETESVAYVVCQHYGINTSDYSFSYVAGWSEGKETPELKASLDKIRKTASEFIYQIDQKMEVLMADKDQVQESAKTSSPFAQELMDKITEGAKDLGFIPVVPEAQEKNANPELKVVVDKALKDLDKKRTLSKVKEFVKSKLKSNTEKAEQIPKKSRTPKAKEERA